MITHASLFSGIGGFDLAAQQVGWQNVLHCENNPFCQRVLRYYWPNAISYADIKTTDFTSHRRAIDVLSGGFPCQPYSLAGKRLGKEDDRHLWPEMLRAVREISPPWVVGENVRGLTSWNAGLVFHEVQSDLETQGYQVLPFLLPASGVGAPHQRYRIWFVAHRPNAGPQGVSPWKDLFSGLTHATHSAHIRQEQPRSTRHRGPRPAHHHSAGSHAAHTYSPRRPQQRHGSQPDTQRHLTGLPAQEPTHTHGGRLEGIQETPPRQEQPYGNPWSSFPTQSPICGGDDGIPPRLDGITFPAWREQSIHGYGNAVVPYLALQIFTVIDQFIHNQIQ